MKITLRLTQNGMARFRTSHELVMIESKSASLGDMFGAMGLSMNEGLNYVKGYVKSGYVSPCLDLTDGKPKRSGIICAKLTTEEHMEITTEAHLIYKTEGGMYSRKNGFGAGFNPIIASDSDLFKMCIDRAISKIRK